MTDPAVLLNKAKKSRFYLWLLNQVLSRMIPFNLPHMIVISCYIHVIIVHHLFLSFYQTTHNKLMKID